jgi:hypothetical protein
VLQQLFPDLDPDVVCEVLGFTSDPGFTSDAGLPGDSGLTSDTPIGNDEEAER